MSRCLTLRWVTRSRETGKYFPGGAGKVRGKGRESAGRIGSTPHRPGARGCRSRLSRPRRVPRNLCWCQHSSEVHRALLVTRAPPGRPAPYERLHSGRSSGLPEALVGGFLGATCCWPCESREPFSHRARLAHLMLSVNLDLILLLARKEGGEEKTCSAGPQSASSLPALRTRLLQ